MTKLRIFLIVSAFFLVGGPASARYYEPSEGRFLQEDPIMLPLPTFSASQSMFADSQSHGSINLYDYALSNPMRFIDPFGTSAEDVQRIYQTYYLTVREMTWIYRLPFGPLNNLSAFFYNTTRGRLGGDYQLCSDQVSTVRRSLILSQQRKPFDAQWSFQDYPVHWNFHMKLRLQSSDPNDPVIILDPWWRLWW